MEINNLFKKIFKRTPRTRMIFFVAADILLISLAVWLAFLLRFDGQIPGQYFTIIKNVVILLLIFSIPIFYFFRLYSFSWSYVSTNDLISLIKATTLSFIFLAVSLLLLRERSFFGFPRSTLVISYFLIIIFSGGIRFSKRIYFQLFSREKIEGRERTLIVGAGDAGEQILRSIQSSPSSPYLPVGFVDDDIFKQGNSIHGIKVLAGIKDIPEIIKNLKVEEMIIALPSVGSKAIKTAVETGRKAGLKKIKVVPPINEIINGEISLSNLRDVKVEDLLGRELVSLDKTAIGNFIRAKKILVTGAAGSIGSELCRQIVKFNPSFILMLDRDETGIFNISAEMKSKFPKLRISSMIADIQDEIRIEQIFKEFHPDIIFHAAAFKHVPLMELHPGEAVKNNIFGTKIVVNAALNHGIERFVFISTDKAVNPISVMGATKRAGEMICQAFNQKNNTKFISVRFGNVLDSRGSVIPIFREQIRKGGPVEVTHPEMKRYFMATPEACLLVMLAGAVGQGGEVFVLDMGDPIKILDLAKDLIRLSGLEPDKDIPIVFTQPRSGEKFFEDILTAEEGTIATQDKNIFIVRLTKIDEKKLNSNLEKLKKAAYNSDKEEIKIILKELIPLYHPSIS